MRRYTYLNLYVFKGIQAVRIEFFLFIKSCQYLLNYDYVLKNGVGRYNIFRYFYTNLAESSFLCRFRVESVNVLVCAMCFFFNKQFCTCANVLPNEVTV
jgi:hypothetical protein